MKIVETLSVESLGPGMTVAEAVVDDGGRMLVPAGAEVSESLAAGLRRRGIETVRVERQVEEDPAAREARRQRLSAELDKRFRRAGESAALSDIYAAVLAYQMEHAA